MNKESASLLSAPLPDELAHGYLGRIRAINMLPNSQRAASTLVAAFLENDSAPESASRARALAMAAGLSLEQFCQHHTLLPFLRASTAIAPDTAHGSTEQLSVVHKSAFRLTMPGHMACPKCIREDLRALGFSYWRRRHQLHGIPWCDTHRAPLIATSNGFDVCPEIARQDQRTYSPSCFDAAIANPVVNRYVEIATGFLDFPKALSFSEAAKKLGERAKKLGIRVSIVGQRKNLSDLALDSVPAEWLYSLILGIEKKRRGAYFPSLDRTLSFDSLPQARALALALMFDTAEEALQYWTSFKPIAPEESNDMKADGLDFWNSRKVFDAYVKACGNRSEVGRILSVHSRRVSGELDRCGLPSLVGLDEETTGRALAEFYSGRSLREACAIYGADYVTCEKLIRQGGVRFGEAIRRMMKRSTGKGSLWMKPTKLLEKGVCNVVDIAKGNDITPEVEYET